MEQYGFYYDAENCVGCHTCHIACKDVNNLPVGKNFRTVRTFVTGAGFTPRIYHLSLACNHCAAPACISACSENALEKDELGLVIVNTAACTGCGDCVTACPYQAITLLDSGKAGKCDGCASLRAQGEDVACIASCPQRVLELRPIDEIRAAHAQETLVADCAPLASSAQTQPHVLIRTRDCMNDRDFDEITI